MTATEHDRTPPVAPAAASRALDPDRLAELEEERDHLARSLRDLDDELAAGDLTTADHATLREDYIARTAVVLRAIEQHRELRAQRPPVPRRRRLLVSAAVVVFAIGAGALVARVAGTRTSSAGLTGDVRGSTREELANCLELAGAALRPVVSGDAAANSNQLLTAVQCYTGVLQRAPGNAQALTYRGWLLVQTGNAQLIDQGWRDLGDAVVADPTYPDARAFRAIVSYRQGDLDTARQELVALDQLDAPPMINSLLESTGLRAAVEAGADSSTATSGSTVTSAAG